MIDCVVMKNSESGRSRGFGFVTFADPANVAIVLQNGPHTLDGRFVNIYFYSDTHSHGMFIYCINDSNNCYTLSPRVYICYTLFIFPC